MNWYARPGSIDANGCFELSGAHTRRAVWWCQLTNISSEYYVFWPVMKFCVVSICCVKLLNAALIVIAVGARDASCFRAHMMFVGVCRARSFAAYKCAARGMIVLGLWIKRQTGVRMDRHGACTPTIVDGGSDRYSNRPRTPERRNTGTRRVQAITRVHKHAFSFHPPFFPPRSACLFTIPSCLGFHTAATAVNNVPFHAMYDHLFALHAETCKY